MARTSAASAAWASSGETPAGIATSRPPGRCRALLDLLANKWSALAIGALEGGPQRFGELQRTLQGVSPKVLTQTLRRLEDFGILDRTIYPAVPLHVEYSLTPLGQSAAIPLNALCAWGTVVGPLFAVRGADAESD
ncbi:winged helix-turn-helix transcriptional regulator [Streptomyces noursei]|uniref:winged helix-turn-helix transcriptional regulator n=1 Tax=Streptomyces noursei TaxID=1971 RepID=UPI000B1D1746